MLRNQFQAAADLDGLSEGRGTKRVTCEGRQQFWHLSSNVFFAATSSYKSWCGTSAISMQKFDLIAFEVSKIACGGRGSCPDKVDLMSSLGEEMTIVHSQVIVLTRVEGACYSLVLDRKI
ncbi:hypothetical protein NE237_030321 [Protea cynaroides]|uniref:Uncharacterized protein n=1 Tax=Protea cynaroides TaxID=273540 RepID=A0A9Q0GTU9_9MAGN|nr:hypothetical protein NE237_030321 [Protea cynaroides]